MALTTAELQANLIAQQQAEAANIVALIESVVDGRLDVVNIDLTALAAKVEAVNTLLDGDPTNEGFQAFLALVARVVALETTSIEHGASLVALQSALTAQGAALNTRIDQVEANTAASLSVVDGRLTAAESAIASEVTRATAADAAHSADIASLNSTAAALETSITNETNRATAAEAVLDGKVTAVEGALASEVSRATAKDAEHDAAIASLNSTATTLQSTIATETSRALAAEAALSAGVDLVNGRVDAVVNEMGNFVTRDELSLDGQLSGQAFINRLWAGKTRPAGLPNTDGTVS